jgi:hypothetical protein
MALDLRSDRSTTASGGYPALLAQAHAEAWRRRPEPRKVAGFAGLSPHVPTHWDKGGILRQIARRLPQEFPREP